MKKKEITPLIKSTFLYLFATAFGQGISFAGMLVFTRIMPKQAYGDYSTYYAYVSILTVLTGGNIYVALNNAYIDKRNEIRKYRKSALVLSTLVMSVVGVMAIFLNSFIYRQFDFIIALLCIAHAYSFFIVTYRTYSANMENDYKRKLLLLVIPYTLQFFFSWILVSAFPMRSYEFRVVGSCIGIAICGIWAYIEMMHCKGKAINRSYWAYTARIAFPSIVTSLSYMLMQHCDRIMIKHYRGSEETAVYSALYYMGYIVIAINMAISPVRQAWLYNKLGDGDKDNYKTIQKWYMIAIVVVGTCLILLGKEIVIVFLPSSYWDFKYILPFVLSSSMAVMYGFPTEIIMYYKRNGVLSAITLASALINIGLNSYFIPRYGAVAACYTTLVAYFMIFLLTQALVTRMNVELYSKKVYLICMVWIVVMLISMSMVDRGIYRYIALLLIMAVFVIYACKKREEIISIINSKG